MKRMVTRLSALLMATTLGANAFAQSPAELAETSSYVAGFQNADGGFAAKAGGPSSLASTSSAIRTLKYTGGSIPNVLGAIKYLKSCFDSTTGGFATTPGGKPDVGTTASGLMAVAELKIATDEMSNGAVKFFSANAKTFEEVRIAIAGLEAVKKTSPDFPSWGAIVKEGRNDDGTFGKGAVAARETGGRAAALLRMGLELDKKQEIVSFLRAAQRPDGAWSNTEDGKPSFETTYRITRFFYMIKEKPDIDRVRAFVASRRNSDGGYTTEPSGESSLGGTYFASIVQYWARALNGEPAMLETAGFGPLLNGEDLSGWEGDRSLWSFREGMLIGDSKGIKQNNFLAYGGTFGSFVLKLSFKLDNGEGNSGVQFRSERVPGTEMSGYQADIGQNYWGCLYDESRRNRVLVQSTPESLKSLRKDGWNQYTIDAKGPQINLALNGVRTASYTEADDSVARHGRIAVQIHAGGPMRVAFKDMYIQRLPEPRADAENRPGFHLRTLGSSGDERKYVVYIPLGYDGATAFPAVLFLHGAGERGKDGVVSAQVGLGPAILNGPQPFPAIAVIPQARQSWSADSDDAKAALAALDQVQKTLKVDPKRVVLTGLSMGGRGTWEVAAANPDRFSAIVPICGRGRPGTASVLAKLPAWIVVGDADSDATVLNCRAMVEALSAAGGKPTYTEYRGVGHNSWDRAYSNPALIEWMLAQSHQ